MSARDELRAELYEWHFGVHPDPERIERLVATDPEAARLSAAVRAEAALLEEAASEPAPPLDLSPPDPGTLHRVPPASSGLWRRTRLAASILFLLAVGVPGALWGLSAFRLANVEQGVVRLVVSGPPGVPDGASARYRVETWDDDGEPRACTVSWRVLDERGDEVHSRFAESTGALDVDLPASLAGARRLEVTAETRGLERAAVLELSPQAGAPLAHLSTDKAAYRPGETVYLRGVLLDRLSLEPLAQSYRFRVVDAKGVAVTSFTQNAEKGVVARSFQVPDDAAGGHWALELRDARDDFTVAEEPFLVRRFQAPRLKKTLELDRETYAPGARGSAELLVQRVEGGVAAGAGVTGILVVDGEEVSREEGALDSTGRAVFAFEVPAEIERGEARFVARVTDGGTVETAVEPFVVPTGRVLAQIYPEGGDLVAGVETRVYFELSDPLDRPISGSGRVVDGAGGTVARFETEHEGRGRFAITPEVGVRYTLVVEEPAPPAGTTPEPIELPRAVSSGVVLRADDRSTRAGEPVRLAVHTPRPGPWMAAAFCRGVLVAQDAFSGAGWSDLALDVAPGVGGVLRVTVFDAELHPLAERLVHRESAQAVDVRVAPEKRRLAPGERQRLAVETRDESGRPVAAVVGLTVSDRAVRDYVGDVRVGLADRTWLLSDVGELEEARPFLTGDAVARRNVDLLLGTLGWRRFAWREPEAFLAAHGADAKRVLVREGRPQVPVVEDTFENDRAALATARRENRDAREAFTGLSVLAVTLAGALVLARLAWRAAERLAPGRRFAAPLSSAVATGFALGITMLLLTQLTDAPGVGTLARHFEATDEAPAAEWAEGIVLGAAMQPVEELHLGRDGMVFFQDFDAQVARGAVMAPPMLAAVPGAGGPGVPALQEQAMGLLRQGELADEDMANKFAMYRVPMQRANRVREYAHRREGGPERHDFTETVYWNALLETGDDGRASVEFDVSDAVTTWAVHADAHGAGRVGQGTGSFEALIPFRLEAALPIEVTSGDRLELPVALVCEDDAQTEARVEARVSGPLALAADGVRDVRLTDGRGRALFTVDVTGTGAAGLAIEGVAGRFSDRVERPVRVVPRGFPHHVAKSGRIASDGSASGSFEFQVGLPADFVPGSLDAVLALYPSPLADLTSGMEGLLQEPSGCFEQASSRNYPNVLALAFMESVGTDAPAVAGRARELLDAGYAKIAGYECSERGYEWFGGDPGHEALTAYGLLEFHDMRTVFDVDQEMVARTREWLLGRRDGDGGFRRNERALDSFGRAPQPVTDAYCTYALAVTGEEPENLAAELDRAAARALESDDAYEVALAACALAAAGRDPAADAARERLKGLQRPDGGLAGSTTSITSSGARDLAVETTSFAILAWLEDADDEAHVQRAIEFLLTQRQAGGRFGATQATIMALKALVAHAQTSRRVANPGQVVVYVNDKAFESVDVLADHRGAIRFEGLADRLREGVNRIRLVLHGENDFPWSFDLAYTSDRPADDPDSPLAISARLARDTVPEGETVSLEVTVQNRTDAGQPMTLAIVGLPAGLEAPTDVLDDLQEAGRFDLWEISGRELVLYWRGLAPRATRSITLDCVARIPGTTTGPASRTYLYYTPEGKRWAEPLTVRVTPAR